jgi:hypothetical protein
MSPLPDETNQTANNHEEYIEGVLESYGKSYKNVFLLCGDNCSTNKKIANDTGLPLIGCHSHIFNLAVENFINIRCKHELEVIEKLCGKLRNKKSAGKLRELGCNLEAIGRNATRWTSSFMMVRRFRDIRSYIIPSNFPDLAQYFPSADVELVIDQLFPIFQKLLTITFELQRQDITYKEVRALFDGAMSLIPESMSYLAENAAVHQNPNFLKAILKLQTNQVDNLSQAESRCLEAFKVHEDAGNVEEDQSDNFAKELLSVFKRPRLTTTYENVNWIPVTSNVVERLFSLAKLTFTDNRQATLPENIEKTLFLKVNSELWNINTVADII